jgi:hypothetical protein
MTKPLLICDCDEVLLHFAGPFRTYLDTAHALELNFESFALSGNIRRKVDGSLVERKDVRTLVDGFFADAMEGQPVVEGAVEALAALSDPYEIVILTNIRDAYRDRRRAQIAALGMPFPVYVNARARPRRRRVHRRLAAAPQFGKAGRAARAPAAHGRRSGAETPDPGCRRCARTDRYLVSGITVPAAAGGALTT